MAMSTSFASMGPEGKAKCALTNRNEKAMAEDLPSAGSKQGGGYGG